MRRAEVDCIYVISGHALESVRRILERDLIRIGEMAAQAFAEREAKEQVD